MILLLVSDINGDVLGYYRYCFGCDTARWTWNEERLELRFSGSSDKVSYGADFRFRVFGIPNINGLSDIQRRDKGGISPIYVQPREAFITLYDIPFGGLEVSVGKKVISWGKADGINPTSQISVYDYEDFFDIGAKLGTNGINIRYSLGNFWVEGVFSTFSPDAIPPDPYSSVFFSSFPDTINIVALNDTINIPKNGLRGPSEFAIRFAGTVKGIDLSLIYFRGYDGIPYPKRIDITPYNLIEKQVKINLIMEYPKYHMLGFNFASTPFNLGFWGEFALFIPDSFETQKRLLLPDPFGFDSVTLTFQPNKPFLRFVLGWDYTFPKGIYANLQYIRGFINERSADSLRDYFILRMEKTFFDGNLKVMPANLLLEVGNWGNIVWIPAFEYYPVDNLTASFGVLLIWGKGDSPLARMEKIDEAFFRIKYSF
ncbi:MAG: hypothetical protein ABIL16_02015 [candidate division WOR-3 bacterium]